MESLKVRGWLATLGILLALVLVSPNLVQVDKMKWWPSSSRLNYGLDIQGGLHLVMGVDVAGVVSESATRLAASLKSEMAKKNINIVETKVLKGDDGEIELQFAPQDKDAAEKYISEFYSTVLQKMTDDATHASYRYYETYMADYKNRVIQQAIETIRNRIDEFGVAEPSISQQGADRILVQLPGMADAEKAKQLINSTAKLDLAIVSTEKSSADLAVLVADAEKAGDYNLGKLKYSDYVARLNKDLSGKLPEKTMLLFEKAPNALTLEAGKIPMLVRTDTGISGEDLDDARVSFGQDMGEPEVAMSFNPMGTRKFGDVTGANVGKAIAIVLDKVVKSAPVVQTAITTGQARITLNGRNREQMMEEAKMIAMSLRAGALPATLEQLEERRVGPTLGADSINKAKIASYVGALLIVLFMLARYRKMGLLANISLGLNILSVFALLTSLGATLTLPGIAGIALTVGFAVDANVLIYERIREEMRAGATFKAAVKEGFHKAMSAILDSNITTAATATVLLYFGTGPVKGFAVTLLVGIVTTLFANVFFTKVLVDTLLYKFKLKSISI